MSGEHEWNFEKAVMEMLSELYEKPSRKENSCKEDCHWYEEWQDMNASIPSCKKKHEPCIDPNDCEDCQYYKNRNELTNADMFEYTFGFNPKDDSICSSWWEQPYNKKE